MLESAPVFARINYYAFVCLTTVAGDITLNLPLSRIIPVAPPLQGRCIWRW